VEDNAPSTFNLQRLLGPATPEEGVAARTFGDELVFDDVEPGVLKPGAVGARRGAIH
jgi:hypothetical protein